MIPWNLLEVQNTVRLNVKDQCNLVTACFDVMGTFLFPTHILLSYVILDVNTIAGEWSHHIQYLESILNKDDMLTRANNRDNQDNSSSKILDL